jgi:RNase P/RNase MRP subunit POP5
MKPLKPSHREKKRYLLIEGRDADKKNIDEVILEFIGVFGYAEASPQFLKIDSNNLIMSVNRKMIDKIRSSFLMSQKDIRIKRVSGSVKKLK